MNDLFWRNVGVKGGPAQCRAYLPHLLELVLDRTINPGLVFDLELPLSEIAEAYAAMDQRRAIKTLVRPWPARKPRFGIEGAGPTVITV